MGEAYTAAARSMPHTSASRIRYSSTCSTQPHRLLETEEAFLCFGMIRGASRCDQRQLDVPPWSLQAGGYSSTARRFVRQTCFAIPSPTAVLVNNMRDADPEVTKSDILVGSADRSVV